MKLRNKKTGEIKEWQKVGAIDYGELNEVYDAAEYNSLAELNNEWEDVKEPIIKDEKIRKFLRAWAEMNGVSDIIVFDKSNSPYIPTGQVVFAENAGSLRVYFRTEEQFDADRIYTVNELCGDEEE